MRKFLLLSVTLLLLGTSSAWAKSVLIVVTNHGDMGNTGDPTGYFLSEVTHPWHVFTQAGYDVEFASPLGGLAPMDPKSFDLSDPINKEFWHELDAVQTLVHTQSLADIDPKAYASIYLPAATAPCGTYRNLSWWLLSSPSTTRAEAWSAQSATGRLHW